MGDNGYEPDYSILNKWPVVHWDWPKPVVFIPMMQSLPFADEVWPRINEIARYGTPFIYQPYMFADRARNEAAKELLDSDKTHIVMLDADHRHPTDVVHRLCRRVIEDPERLVVGGLNFKRNAPFSPLACYVSEQGIYRPHEWEPECAEVDAIGTGCIIIAREVFEQVEWPWFINDPHYPSKTLGSHDNYFCQKAKEAGIKIWCDFTLTSPHGGTHWVTEQTYRTYCQVNPIPEEDIKDVQTEIHRE